MRNLLWALVAPATALAVPYPEQIRLAYNATPIEEIQWIDPDLTGSDRLIAANTVQTAVPLAASLPLGGSAVTVPLAQAAGDPSSTTPTTEATSDADEFKVTVTFIRPTIRENGAVLPSDEIGGYRLVCSDPENLERLIGRSAYISSESFLKDIGPAPVVVNPFEVETSGIEPMFIKYVHIFIKPEDTIVVSTDKEKNEVLLKHSHVVDQSKVKLTDKERVYCSIATEDTDGLMSEMSDVSDSYAEYRLDKEPPSAPSAPVLEESAQVGLLGLVINTEPAQEVPPQGITLTWGQPKTMENGKPLDLSTIKHYNVYCGTTDNVNTLKESKVATVPAGTYTHNVENFLPTDGTKRWCGITAVDKNDLESKLAMSSPFWLGGCLPADNRAPGAPSDVLIRLIP